jgi:Hydrolytic ATP binding site of dynein motor region
MVVPDMEQICEIMLFSEGFDTAKVNNSTILLSTRHAVFDYFLQTVEDSG